MPLTLPLPDWMPWWAQLVLLILAILFGFALLMMPFSVFGLKGRLDFLEAQLDDIHAELRMIATRLPDPDRAPAREPVFEELVRPAPRREPSPTQTRLPDEPPARAPVPIVPAPVAPEPARRFNAGPDPRPVTPPRRPAQSDDWTPMRAVPVSRPEIRDEPPRLPASDWETDDADRLPRRLPRATTLRDPGRDRSEPTLRWPPPR